MAASIPTLASIRVSLCDGTPSARASHTIHSEMLASYGVADAGRQPDQAVQPEAKPRTRDARGTVKQPGKTA